jgi:hypothetical protein
MLYQKGGMTGTAGSRINIPFDGLYHISAQLYFQAVASGTNGGRRGIAVTRNAAGANTNVITQILYGVRDDALTQSGASCDFDYELVAGDYLEVQGYHDAAAAINNLGASGSFMTVRWVAPL